MYECLSYCCIALIFFFFQAEDGIRDLTVTGVQTCALPICDHLGRAESPAGHRRQVREGLRHGRRSRAERDRLLRLHPDDSGGAPPGPEPPGRGPHLPAVLRGLLPGPPSFPCPAQPRPPRTPPLP